MAHEGLNTRPERQVLCLLAGGIAAIGLLGWVFDIAALKSIVSGLTTMKANTALCLLALAAATALVAPASRGRTRAAAALAGLTLLASGLTLIEYGSGLRLGIDQLLFADPATFGPDKGRMSLATAIGLFGGGWSVLLLAVGRSPRELRLAHYLSGTVGAVGFISLAGYAYGVAGLYSFAPFATVALHTGVAFSLLTAAILLTRANDGWRRAFRDRPIARSALAQVSTMAVIGPLVIGFLVERGIVAGLYDARFAPALFAVAATAGLLVVAFRVAFTLRRAELELQASGEAVAQLERARSVQASADRDFLQSVVDGSVDPIFVKDTAGRFVLANNSTADVYGVSRDTMIGKLDGEFVPGTVATALSDVDQAIISDGVTRIVEENVPRRGVTRTFLSAKSAWRQDGAIKGVIGVAHDITDRKAAEVALDRLNHELEARVVERTATIEAAQAQVRQMQKIEAIGQLTGGIAHDFNNMLSIVIGSLDLARRRVTSRDAAIVKYLDSAAEGARRAAELTSRLLAFARQQPLQPAVIDVNKLVATMSELLRRTIGDAVSVETVLAGGLWGTRADPGQLEAALLNLCVNARDAMAGGGRLTIETNNASLDDAYARAHVDVAAGQYVLVMVSDTGEGMPPEVIERAFDPFFTTKALGKGTGLGLSQVFGFIKQSGGHVAIYSEPGAGSSVKIYLPRTRDVVRAAAATRPGAAIPLARPGECVLIVEDDPNVRHVNADGLRELGYVVYEASGGVEALTVIAAHAEICLLFTDVMMPDMNGRALAERVAAARPDIPVLFTSGFTRNAIVHNGMVDDDVSFLPKPFSIDQLALKIRGVFDARPSQGGRSHGAGDAEP